MIFFYIYISWDPINNIYKQYVVNIVVSVQCEGDFIDGRANKKLTCQHGVTPKFTALKCPILDLFLPN